MFQVASYLISDQALLFANIIYITYKYNQPYLTKSCTLNIEH